MPSIRNENGQFIKGAVGNPKGRPKVPPELRDACRSHTKEAVERLVFWMRSSQPDASLAAIKEIFDRGWGKAALIVGEDPERPFAREDDRAWVVQQLARVATAQRQAANSVAGSGSRTGTRH